MYKFQKNLFCLLLVLSVFSSCKKKAFDEHYERPATLAPPIYQVLQARGNFTNFLACADKAGYKDILNSQGYWTLFAPNDAAFTKFFADPANVAKGITSLDKIDANLANKIVSYSLVYNAAATDHIADYQGAIVGAVAGYQPNLAFKRRTAYHANVDTVTINANNAPNLQPTLLGQTINIVGTNTNGGNPYVLNDYNNKYIPYFTSSADPNFPSGGFFGRIGLNPALDYNTFFPNTPFTGFNVVDGSVVNANIPAENGVIHEINTVVTPLPNLEEYLASKPDYSHYKQLFDRYMVNYASNVNFTHLNQVATGSSALVYVKTYAGQSGAGAIPSFALNNESYGAPGTAGQYQTYTLLAPSNASFDGYVNSVLLEHYSSIAQLPINVISDFINSQMFTQPLWPSKFNLASNVNSLGESTKITLSNVTDPKFCSNGIFYGTNQVNAPNAFASVYGRVYLDPDYSLMKVLFDNTAMKINLTLYPGGKYTVILYSNAQLAAAGFSYSTVNGAFTYVAPPGGYTNPYALSAQALLSRIVAMGIFRTDANELSDISGSGIYQSAGIGGNAPEYVKYSGNTFQGPGNAEANNSVPMKISQAAPNPSPKQTINGITYYSNTSGPLLFPSSIAVTAVVGTNLAKYGTNPTDPYYYFFQYLKNNVALFNTANNAILGVDGGVPFTVLVPTNAAMQDAVNNGWLPSTGTGAVKTPLFNPTVASDIALVTNFMKYHFIKGFTIAPDGKQSGPAFSTLLFNSNGDQVTLRVDNGPGQNNMRVIDGQARIANVANSSTAVLANYAIIQSIDTYLQYIDPYSFGKY